MRITHFWDEFKKFAFKGNLVDLAVAVVIGNAFGALINSLVKDIIMPTISYVVGLGGVDGKVESYKQWHVGQVEVGPFLAELVHFLIIALAMFVLVVKLFGTMQRLLSPHGDTPTTKECPYCLSVIPIKAVKCSQCTSDLDGSGARGREHEAIGAESS